MAIWTRFMAGLNGFTEAWTNADPQRQRRQMGDFDSFGRFDARQFRYDLFWGCYQNNVFRELAHSWAPAVKETFGLYRHTRNIFNPVGRLVEFHATHLHGGRLDPAAGDGETVKSAIPILTDREAIRPALARLWRDSKMQVSKAILDRFGACLGDVGLKAVDDPIRRRVTLQVVHPGHVKWADWDDAGDVKEYIIEEVRFDDEHAPLADMNPTIDPRSMRLTAIYSEEAVIEGGRVRYRTFKNGVPHNWRGRDKSGVDLPAEWTVPYRFVPLVLVQHKAFGDDWGMGEPHGLLSKAFEVDDQASGLGDQIRKAIRAPKFISGVKKPREQVMVSGLAKSDDDAEPDRHGQAILYGPEGAQVFDMTFPLDIVGVGAHIDRINAEIERDFPELAMDIWGNGDTSGRALKVARQRVESKIQERRPSSSSSARAGTPRTSPRSSPPRRRRPPSPWPWRRRRRPPRPPALPRPRPRPRPQPGADPMGELNAGARRRLAATAFALPAERKYPIEDVAHARNALARVAQYGTPAEKAKVRAAVKRRYPGLA
jgi:hypothetical protein